MMGTIKDQKEVLINLRSDLDIAEVRLEEASKMTMEMEMKREVAETDRLMAEEETRRVNDRKKELEIEIQNFEEAKVITKQSLDTLHVEVRRMRKELDVNGDEMTR